MVQLAMHAPYCIIQYVLSQGSLRCFERFFPSVVLNCLAVVYFLDFIFFPMQLSSVGGNGASFDVMVSKCSHPGAN